MEATCYVPMESDEAKREPSAVTYVLPDLRRGSRGFVAAAKEEKGVEEKKEKEEKEDMGFNGIADGI